MKDTHSDSKKVILMFYTYIQDIADNAETRLLLLNPEVPERVRFLLKYPQKAVAEACRISVRSMQRFCAEKRRKSQEFLPDNVVQAILDEDEPNENNNNNGPGHEIALLDFNSPRKKYRREAKVTHLDSFDKSLLRRIIFEYYDRKEYPTTAKLHTDLEQWINFSGSLRSVLRILKDIGFKYRKGNDGRKRLMERTDIVACRNKFLRKMHELRTAEDSRPIIYLDETWVNKNHSPNYVWTDEDGNGGVNVPIGKGGRDIICHAGSKKHGFLHHTQLVFRSKKSGDYHEEMNGEVFSEWFDEMLRGLEEPCVICMDNASYHSMLAEKVPTTNWKKGEIVEWLQEKKIDHNPGHEVVRLPPYHCQYNPIELIWAQVKGEVAKKNKTFKMDDVEELTVAALRNVTVENWRKAVEHAEKLQEEDFLKSGLQDKMPELRFYIGSDTSSDDDSDE